jgi:hypothetical protein
MGMLRPDLQHELDAKLERLLSGFRDGRPYGQLAAETRQILDAYEHEPGNLIHQYRVKLLQPGWEGAWKQSEDVYSGLFGDLRSDRVARSQWELFVELIRFTIDSPTSYHQGENRRSVVTAICDFLSRRGYDVNPATAKADAAEQGEGEQVAKPDGKLPSKGAERSDAAAKKSQSRRTSKEIFRAALRTHHEYESDIFTSEAASCRRLEEVADGWISDSTVRRCLIKDFGSVANYRRACRDGTIAYKLTLLMGETLKSVDPSIIEQVLAATESEDL